MQTIKHENDIKPIDTMIAIDIDAMYRIIHDDENDCDDFDFTTDVTSDDFKAAFESTSQPMLNFLGRHQLVINRKTNMVQFDIASFHKIIRELNILTVEYDTIQYKSEPCVFPTDPKSLSYKYDCTHDDHLDFNVSIIELVIEILTDFYYHELNANHLMGQ